MNIRPSRPDGQRLGELHDDAEDRAGRPYAQRKVSTAMNAKPASGISARRFQVAREVLEFNAAHVANFAFNRFMLPT